MHRLAIRRVLLIVCEIALILGSSSIAAQREQHVVVAESHFGFGLTSRWSPSAAR